MPDFSPNTVTNVSVVDSNCKTKDRRCFMDIQLSSHACPHSHKDTEPSLGLAGQRSTFSKIVSKLKDQEKFRTEKNQGNKTVHTGFPNC